MIFFSDMDGTFLTSEKRISEGAWRALDAVARTGAQFVPCTGRALSGLPDGLTAHPAVRYAICANGASVFDAATGEPLRRVCLGAGRALQMYGLTRGRDVTFDVFADGACYCERRCYDRLAEFVDDPHILASMRASRTPVDVGVPELVAGVNALERVAMYWKDPADRDALWPLAEGLENVSVVRSYPMNIEVSDAQATKGRALVWLCDRLGVDPADAYAFGDNLNDLSMIEEAGCGVAMANADPVVRAGADRVTGSNDEDGVAAVIMEALGR